MIEYEQTRKNLLEKIETLSRTGLGNFKVLSMSDFILDHTLYIDDLDSFFDNIKKYYKQGGGDFTAVKQNIQSGGCSTNAAMCLGNLGLDTYFIGRTSQLGERLLEFFLEKKNINIKHIKTDGALGLMTIFEIGNRKINIMVGDLDSLSALRYKDLDNEDKKIISSCDLVGIFGWAMNKTGTDLAHNVFNYAKKTDTLTYFDTADPSSRSKEIEDLFNLAIANSNLDILSLNENELNHYSNFITDKAASLNICEKGILLEKNIPAKLDIHTALYAVSIENGEVCTIPSFKVSVKRATGAGDMFNSGNILGYLLKLKSSERLMLANAMACFYISSDTITQPRIEDIGNFISDKPLEHPDSFFN